LLGERTTRELCKQRFHEVAAVAAPPLTGGRSMTSMRWCKTVERIGLLRLVAAMAGGVGCVLLVVASASAQDVVQVGGDTHKVLLENAQVRVLAVKIKAGEKVPMHAHPASVSYLLTDGKLRITLADGKTVDKEPKAGTATWSEAVTHAVENIGTGDFTQVQIELKNAAPAK
jgi:quercetin dioxygenase-like cupin family protein